MSGEQDPNAVALRELIWYRANGKYPDRITKDILGRDYVIGDFSWNKGRPEEHIERLMSMYGVYDK